MESFYGEVKQFTQEDFAKLGNRDNQCQPGEKWITNWDTSDLPNLDLTDIRVDPIAYDYNGNVVSRLSALFTSADNIQQTWKQLKVN